MKYGAPMNNSDNRKLPIVRITISAVLLVVAAFVWMNMPATDDTPTAAESSRALIGGPFELVNHKNEPVTDDDFLGKYMLVYFGYTYCPDVCPMDLQIMSDALGYLDQEKIDQLNSVFVSVDPDRDTPEVMAEYVSFFHEDMIGLTGTQDQINEVKKAYRVYAAKADDSSDYLVDHTAYTYLMDKEGKLLQHFNHGEDPEKMAAKISALIQ